LIEQYELAEEERFLMGWTRAAELPFMQRVIHPWTRERTVDEIIELATALRIPASPIGNGQNLPHMDHFVARGVFSTGPGGFLRPRPPYLLENTTHRPFGPAPKLGAHTNEVMKEIQQRSPLLTKEGPRGRSGAQTAAAPAEVSSALPLAGLRVIDLTAMWAGPYAGSYLADMGADVVKVESIQRPDGMRLATTVGRDPLWEWAFVFAGANPGKRDVTLNLTTEAGLGLLKRLVQTADVVMEAFAVRVLEQFGLSWNLLHALNPRAIMVRMPSFGLDGPWRDRTGWAMNMEQVSGMAWLTGYDDQPLVVRGVCDPVGGMNAVFALLLALEERQRTGRGQLVEVPLVEAALNLAAEQVIEYSAYGKLLMRSGNRGPYAAPQGVYRCAENDEYVALAVATDAQWNALCALVAPEWAGDPQLATVAGRRNAHDMLDARLEEWLARFGSDAAVDRLVAAGVPAQALVNAHDAWRNPQLAHRRFFQVMQHPVTGATRYPGLPIVFSALDRHLHRSPPPTLGQHNDEILGGELGLSANELADLRARKIIGERPSFM
jgi:crotonobetainyl-CoA:carnitine CoA-transferase CaiB-like acyl-CoA transferase